MIISEDDFSALSSTDSLSENTIYYIYSESTSSAAETKSATNAIPDTNYGAYAIQAIT